MRWSLAVTAGAKGEALAASTPGVATWCALAEAVGAKPFPASEAAAGVAVWWSLAVTPGANTAVLSETTAGVATRCAVAAGTGA